MLQNVLSFFTKNLTYFQVALGAWQILKSTLPGVFIQGVMGRLLSFALPGFFPAYEQLRDSPGCLFKTVKMVVLTKGKSQIKTKPEAELPTMEKAQEKMPLQASGSGAKFRPVDYLGETFKVKKKGNKVLVNGEMSYYISDRGQWEKILQMGEECFEEKAVEGRSKKENKVVFVKGCQLIWPTVATGKIMEFGEVLDDVIFENSDAVLTSDNVWFLPVDLSEKLEGKLRKLLNLVGLFCSTHKKPPFLLLAKSFSIVSGILEIKLVRSPIYWIINKMFCRSVQYICNKLPYPVRRFVYLLFFWVENLMPRNDILLQVVRRDWDIVIGGSAKINSEQEATRVDWLDRREEYGRSIVMKATYDEAKRKCTATVQHTSAVFGTVEEKLLVKCQSREQFMKIGTFLSCLANSKAGSLFQCDRNDDIVHVRKWKRSVRDYVDAEFPVIYKLRLQDVIV